MKKRSDPKPDEEASHPDATPIEERIPERLIELAQQLQRALAARRRLLKQFH